MSYTLMQMITICSLRVSVCSTRPSSTFEGGGSGGVGGGGGGVRNQLESSPATTTTTTAVDNVHVQIQHGLHANIAGSPKRPRGSQVKDSAAGGKIVLFSFDFSAADTHTHTHTYTHTTRTHTEKCRSLVASNQQQQQQQLSRAVT